MIEAQRIACENSAWVEMSFAARSNGPVTPLTNTYPIGQTQVIDLAYFPFREGLDFWPDVKVSADLRSAPPPQPQSITFKMNGRTARYKVTDYTYKWKVTFDSIGEPSGRPPLPGFPAKVPLNVLPYNNWDLTVTSPGVLTAAPQTHDDVVTLCNWAKDNGYKIRPRGVMHGWSPLTIAANVPSGANVLLVDLTKSFWRSNFLPASDGLPNRVKVETGTTMLDLMEYLEGVAGGGGSAPGYGFPHTPAPGDLTVGGVLAIDAHGTAVPTPPDDNFPASYGSMSNQILELVAVVTDPNSATPGEYTRRTFTRSEPDAKALLTHVGRALVVEATLQVVDNYNLRCRSLTDLPWQTLFARPDGPISENRFTDFVSRHGRVEVIWFPFSDNPWVHVWSVEPTQPAGSVKVDKPYNYPFADHVPDSLQKFIRLFLEGVRSATPDFGKLAARVTANGLDGKNVLGGEDKAYLPPSRDIWGPSKNTLLYVQDTTLRVTANGYAVQMKKADVQRSVSDFAFKFDAMLKDYAGRDQYPINSPLEIRVTSLDDPAEVGGVQMNVESPVISALSRDALAIERGWDVALWLDILTIPGTPYSDRFYAELEAWLVERFSGDAGRVLPEWSKGWGYLPDQGAWVNPEFLDHIRQGFTRGRGDHDNWQFEVETLNKYDQSNLFTNPLLSRLFQAPTQ